MGQDRIKKGSLVQKRWGRIEPYQQGVLGVNLGIPAHGSFPEFIRVVYPCGKVSVDRAQEFEVISESR